MQSVHQADFNTFVLPALGGSAGRLACSQHLWYVTLHALLMGEAETIKPIPVMMTAWFEICPPEGQMCERGESWAGSFYLFQLTGHHICFLIFLGSTRWLWLRIQRQSAHWWFTLRHVCSLRVQISEGETSGVRPPFPFSRPTAQPYSAQSDPLVGIYRQVHNPLYKWKINEKNTFKMYPTNHFKYYVTDNT